MRKLLALCLAVFLCSGCATYEGLTNLRIRAEELTGQAGPFHNVSGKNVDLSLTRKMGLTNDTDRPILPNPDIKMSNDGNASTFGVVSGCYTR